jgi:hypothetical protein
VAVRSENRINGDSAGNYNLMDKESTGGMFTVFHRELPVQGCGIYWRNGNY